jgi:dienelactone hydrolase
MENTFSYKNINFKSGKNTLKGILFTPEKSNGKSLTIIGPVGYVKEQAPLLYGQNFASKGYTAIIFDATYHGESEGTPRRFENGNQKAKDIIASIDFLNTLPQTNPSEIYGVGICQGINWMVKAANKDPRIKSISLVAGHYLDPEIAELYNGGKERLTILLEKSKKAKEAFLTKGEVDYIPIVGSTDEDALLAAPIAYDWYMQWENNANGKGGKWENKITRMSILEIWGGNIKKDLQELKTPTLVIHSNKAASGPLVPKRLFKEIAANNKKLVWYEDQVQFDFYEDEKLIDRVVNEIINLK